MITACEKRLAAKKHNINRERNEKETETEIHTDRQTERQTDRHTRFSASV